MLLVLGYVCDKGFILYDGVGIKVDMGGIEEWRPPIHRLEQG